MANLKQNDLGDSTREPFTVLATAENPIILGVEDKQLDSFELMPPPVKRRFLFLYCRYK